jgi:acetolactate synthase I/II/III large subunit
MNGAQIIAEVLKHNRVERVYIYPGGTIAPLLDALLKQGIDYICTRTEQGAGYAAIGAAKVSGKPQVIIVTSGPGATNVLTPMADAYYDSIPIVLFTGQVGHKDINLDHLIRQKGFQEIDSKTLYDTITKEAEILFPTSDLSKIVNDLFNSSLDKRPGPVLLDLPMDTQREENTSSTGINDLVNINQDHVSSELGDVGNKIIEQLQLSERPVILAGNGVHISNSEEKLLAFVNETAIPVVSSLPGLGSLPTDHELFFSYLGHTGEYFSNLAVYHSDCILVLGARLDIRQTGTEIEHFANKTIIRVDIDNSELEHARVASSLECNIDVNELLSSLNPQIIQSDLPDWNNWVEKIKGWKVRYDSAQFFEGDQLNSIDIIKAVDKISQNDTVVVTTGVGGHQQMAARYFTYSATKRQFLTSAGHGAMGYDLPAAIGAIMEKRHDYGIVFAGDGSFLMNIQELGTVKEFNLALKIFVLNNDRLGVVSQFQIQIYNSDPGTGNKVNPSFSAVAESFGLKGYDIHSKAEVDEVLKKVFADNSPCVVDCHISYDELTVPMLMGGQTMDEMYPFEKNED